MLFFALKIVFTLDDHEENMLSECTDKWQECHFLIIMGWNNKKQNCMLTPSSLCN